MMPTVYIIGGPNGTGKTTFYFLSLRSGFIQQRLPFINVDLIAQSLGGYTAANYALAPERYRHRVKELLDAKQDLMIESNLAESRNYDWIASMKKAGYDAVLFYLSTNNVETNIARVKQRLAEGGHDIPEAIIRSRYAQSHSYLKTKLREFKAAFLIDNSTDVFRLEAELNNGTITFKHPEASAWVKDALRIVERLAQKRGKL